MTTHLTHPHAAFDRYPQLVRDLEAAFGSGDLAAIVAHVIDAERADFCWDGRIAEMNLGTWDDGGLDDEGAYTVVAVLGYFRARYYVAQCLVDGNRAVHGLIGLRHFDSFERAEMAFLDSQLT